MNMKHLMRYAVFLAFTLLTVSGLQAQTFNDIFVETADEGISPNNGECSLIEAMINAENDVLGIPECEAGSSTLVDRINIPSDMTITFTQVNNDTEGNNALPVVNTEMVIRGGTDSIIQRDENATKMRFFYLGEDADLTLENLTFRQGYSANNGGVVFSPDGALVTIRNSQFISNRSDRVGAALAIWNGMLTVRNSNFSGNDANSGNVNEGAAIHSQDSDVTVEDSTFISNATNEAGGTLFQRRGTLAISGSTFRGSSSRFSSGGTVYAEDATLTIVNSVFEDSYAGVHGGAIFQSRGTLSVSNSTFTNTTATREGGFLFNRGGTVTISNSTFTNNQADDAGGGLFNVDGTVTISNSTFTDNSAPVYDGGAIWNNSNLTINNSVFTNNTVGRHGGAIFNHDDSTTAINGTSFLNNTAGRGGGAIYSGTSGTMPLIHNNAFTSNSANTSGGAIYLTVSGFENLDENETLQDNLIRDNFAKMGGGLYIDSRNNGDIRITRTTFMENRATGADSLGGALFHKGTGAPRVNNSTFYRNRAVGKGGAIYNESGTLNLSHLTFADNESEIAGGAIANLTTVNLRASLLAYSTNNNCDGSITTQGYNISDDFSCVMFNTGDANATDPLISNVPANNGGITPTIRFLNGSPAFNRIPAESCTLQIDQRGVVRPVGDQCESGAYEGDPTGALPPQIVTQPQTQTILSGTSATLSVDITGTTPFVYQWYRGSSGDTSNSVGTNSDSFTTPALDSDTSYWVRISNDVDVTDSDTAVIIAGTPPTITEQPQDIVIPPSATGTLSVAVDGTQPFTYQWYEGEAGNTLNPLGTNSPNLTTPLLTEDTQYWVRVSNAVGQVDSDTATVTISDLPATTLQLQGTDDDATNATPFTVEIIFTVVMNGFEVTDISVTNGSAANLQSDDNQTFTVDITPDQPTQAAQITIEIPADAATSAASGAGNLAASYTVAFDPVAPVVTVDALTTQDTTPPLSGTVDDPDASIEVSVGEQTVSATNDGDGTWSLGDGTLTPLVAGTYDVVVTATDTLGNTATDDSTDELVIEGGIVRDVDGDGFITALDLIFVVNRLGDPATVDNQQADVNGDNAITVDDFNLVLEELGQAAQ